MKSFQETIESELQKLVIPDPIYKAFREKSTKHLVLGLRLPVLHTFTSTDPLLQSASIKDIDLLFRSSKIHEAMTIALMWFQHKKELTLKDWGMLKSWIGNVENWEHADTISFLYSKLFERFPEEILPTLKKWNTSKEPWKQRISIVSLIYYASPKRKAPPVTLVFEMIEPLIGSSDMYVQKAVGWTLRECYNLNPKQTLVFLKKHIQSLASHSFSYATEKLTPEEKLPLKQARSRQKS